MELDQEKQNQEAAERCRALAQRIVRELAPRSVQVLEDSGLLEKAFCKMNTAVVQSAPELLVVADPQWVTLPAVQAEKVLLVCAEYAGMADCAKQLAAQGFCRELAWKDRGKEQLTAGQKFILTSRNVKGTKEISSITYKDLPHDVSVGGRIMLDDGLISLRIESITDTDIVCTVENDGVIKTKKGVNVPGVHLSMPYMSQRDRDDILFGIEQGYDLISASFTRSAQDIRHLLDEHNANIRIIAKIENQEGIDNIDEILSVADGIMVARGDLGVECPIQTVPVMQKKIVAACRKYGRPVIIATQMLESMIKAPTPTRAEVSDVATAVYDGADTVMLSAETAAGDFPVEAVQMMNNIIQQVEADPLFYTLMQSSRLKPCCAGEADSITFAASEVSNVLKKVAAIVTYTSSGLTTFLTARERPNLPILAITPDLEVARRMGIVWGAKSFVNKEGFKSFDKIEDIAKKIAVENGFAKPGQHIIITAGFPLGKKGRTNMLHTVYIPE